MPELFFEDHSTERIGVCYGGYAYTAEELAGVFGELVKEDIANGKSPAWIAERARFAFRLAALALESRDQDARNWLHRLEVNRAFATLPDAWRGKADQ